ncbi:MAG: hypothetical protein KJ676_14610 [Alphaproteobacteria bacterium]|nr:hypothetical protein [Alphaproteobacteria bacterium]MBU1526915.1 hypothetical protein [Alphaproteobacteria bacterium]MBU2352505.1 hypothetical protein [Alphaproteobacteria bacterium]MBU2382007.1 hypothetical protein [Alphaproteobacteria bacterium]
MNAATRFVGGPALDAMLADANLTRDAWNDMAARGAVPPATYAWPGAAKWKRADVLAALAAQAAQAVRQPQPQNHEH